MPSQSTPRKSAGNGGGGRRRANGKGGGGGPGGGGGGGNDSSQQQQSSSSAHNNVLGSPSSTTSSSSSDLRAKLAKAAEIEAKLSSASASSSSSASKSKSGKGGGSSGGSSGGAADQDSKLTRMIMDLCELLSDALLSDPSLAARKDAAGRLWRGCFYSRIGELRGRIQRERNRARRCAGRGDKAGMVKHGKAAEELEGNFRTFLEEAVVLYEYLVDKYREMLMPPPPSSQSQSVQSSQGSESVAAGSGGRPPQSQESVAKGNKKRRGDGGGAAGGKDSVGGHGGLVDLRSRQVPAGVVPTLHKMYIHLGDLHRYAKSYGKAERCYALSSRLAPGKGNPYNQLAVVAQLRGDAAGQQQQQGNNGNGSGGGAGGKGGGPQGQGGGGGGGQQCPQTAVALYWYARSLRATGEPFPTSRSNLARLFSVNRQWLEKSGDGSSPSGSSAAALPAEASGGGKSGGGGGGPGSVEILTSAKAQAERARALKSMQARRFLAAFVDLHWDLFRGVVGASYSPSKPASNSADAQTAPPVSAGDATGRMKGLLADFSSLLEGPSMAFGDALLCKLVAVNAFACCNDEGGPEDDGNGGDGDWGGMELSNALSRAFFLAFGAALAEHAASAAEKLEEKRREKGGGDDGGGVPSLRLLLPLALTCEFASSLYGDGGRGGGGATTAMSMERAEDVVAACGDGGAMAFLAESQRSFWKNATSVANALRRSEVFLPLMLERAAAVGSFDDEEDGGDDHTMNASSAAISAGAAVAVPREFDGLRGFSPFERFLPVHKNGGGGGRSDSQQSSKKRREAYLVPAEAAAALEAYQEECASSKTTGGGSGGGKAGGGGGGPKNNDADNRARVLRFASFVRRHMGLDEGEPGTFFVRSDNPDHGGGGGGELACAFRTRATAVVAAAAAVDDEAGGDDGGDAMDLDDAASSSGGGVAAADAVGAQRVAETVSPMVVAADEEEEDEDGTGGDLLVYKAPGISSSGAGGGAVAGPALLVPSDLLLSGGGVNGGVGTAKITTQPKGATQDNAAASKLPPQLSAGATAMSSTPPVGSGGNNGGGGGGNAGFLSPDTLSAPPPRGVPPLLSAPAGAPLRPAARIEVQQLPPQPQPPVQQQQQPPAAMAGLSPMGSVHVGGPGLPVGSKALPQSLPAKPPPGFSSGGAGAAAPPPPPPGFGAANWGIVPPQPQIQAHHQLHFQSRQQGQPTPQQMQSASSMPSWIAGSGMGQPQLQQQHHQSIVAPGIGGFPTQPAVTAAPGPVATANPFASFARGAAVEQQRAPLGFVGGISGGRRLSSEAADNDATMGVMSVGNNDADDDLFGLRSLGLLSEEDSSRPGGDGVSSHDATQTHHHKSKDPFAIGHSLNLPTETRNPFFAS